MRAIEILVEFLVDHGMSESDAHALISQLLEEEAEDYLKTIDK